MILSVIVPAFNEERSIEEILRRVFVVPIDKEVIVVNDASRDGTKDILERIERDFPSKRAEFPHVKRLQVIHKEKNAGKGAGIRTGIEHVTGDVVLIQDADLELDPNEYPKLMEPFEKHGADVVFGSRFRKEGVKKVHRYWHYVINRLFTMASNILSGLNLTDMWTCYKVFRTPVIKSFTIECNRFGMEPEIVAKLAKMDISVYEVGVSYNFRGWKEGKKIGFKDGLEALWVMVKYNLLK